MDLQLRGRTALVTGASAGIGRAIAKGLAREGARVAFTGRRREQLESLAAEIVAAGGEPPVIVIHDAMEEGYVDAIEAGLKPLGPLAILVNNAGGSRAFGMEGTEAQWHEGLNGAFCAKAALTAWAKGLSREVGEHGITVNCIPPGRIMSDQIRRNYTPEYREWQSKHEIPAGRYGEPEELADLAVFLA